MIKKNVTPQQTVDFLNSLLEADRRAIESLFNARVLCNKRLRNHPTVQVMVRHGKKNLNCLVGFIGILNGLFGTDKDGWGCISMDITKDNKLKGFRLIKEGMKK